MCAAISGLVLVACMAAGGSPVLAAGAQGGARPSDRPGETEHPRTAAPQPVAQHTATVGTRRKVVLELNGGIIRPRGTMRLWRGFDGRPLFAEAAWGGMTVGARVSRFAQIDFGIDITAPVIGGDREAIDERIMRQSFGIWEPRDPNAPIEGPVSDGPVFMMPFGPRLIVPIFRDRLVLGFGGGGAFLLHGEANDRVHPVLGRGCAATCENRYGFGGYGLARVEFVPASPGRIGIGFMARYTRARLSGGGYLPRFSGAGARDEWLQVGGTLALRF